MSKIDPTTITLVIRPQYFQDRSATKWCIMFQKPGSKYRYINLKSIGRPRLKDAVKRIQALLAGGQDLDMANWEQRDCTCPRCGGERCNYDFDQATQEKVWNDEPCPRCLGKGYTDIKDEDRYRGYLAWRTGEDVAAAI